MGLQNLPGGRKAGPKAHRRHRVQKVMVSMNPVGGEGRTAQTATVPMGQGGGLVLCRGWAVGVNTELWGNMGVLGWQGKVLQWARYKVKVKVVV